MTAIDVSHKIGEDAVNTRLGVLSVCVSLRVRSCNSSVVIWKCASEYSGIRVASRSMVSYGV